MCTSADSRALLFGLGSQGCNGGVSQIAMEIPWPNGKTQRLEPGTFGLDRYVTIDYPTGLVR